MVMFSFQTKSIKYILQGVCSFFFFILSWYNLELKDEDEGLSLEEGGGANGTVLECAA